MWKKIHKHRALYTLSIEHRAAIESFLFISFAAAAIPFSCNNFYNFFFFCSFLPFHFVCTFFPFEMFAFVRLMSVTMWNFCIEWYETWIEAFVQNSARKKKEIKLQHFTWSICLEIHSHFKWKREEFNRIKIYEKTQNMTITSSSEGNLSNEMQRKH